MANEISHPPRELAVLVVRRVGVVSVIVPAGPSRKKGRKEGRSVLFYRCLGGKEEVVVKRENKTVTERWLFPSILAPASLRVFRRV